jgi:site-specific DNA-methyltransferase (adenine-specific)
MTDPVIVGNATLYLGDCIEVMAWLPDASVDLTVTSPPYDNLRTYNGTLNDWTHEKWQAIIRELFRVTKQGGVVVWVVGDATINGSETGTSFRQALYAMDCGFRLHDTMIYAKSSYMPLTHNRYEQAFEYMFVWSKGKPKAFNPLMVPSATAGTTRNRGKSKSKEATYAERKRDAVTVVKAEKQRSNVFTYHVGRNDRTLHTAPFPEALARDQILSWSNPGDAVFDPFLGSGTTGKMALLEGRRFIGIEREPKYFDIACRRIEAAPAKEGSND